VKKKPNQRQSNNIEDRRGEDWPPAVQDAPVLASIGGAVLGAVAGRKISKLAKLRRAGHLDEPAFYGMIAGAGAGLVGGKKIRADYNKPRKKATPNRDIFETALDDGK